MSRLALMIATLIIATLVGACERPNGGDDTESTIELTPCRLRGGSGLTSVPAKCGRLTVPENPDDATGRTIDLFVARIPALNQKLPSSAFTVLAGGPGQAATELYADYAGAFEAIQRHRDIILVDQRGTGQSSRLDCAANDANLLEFSPAQAAAAAVSCLASFEQDTRYYTTSVAVRDLNSVRVALGYRQLDIYGVSYGTRVAQHYLKRYPEHVRTVVIDGVVPVGVKLGPQIATDAQAALEAIFARCANDKDCNTHFPNIDETFAQLSARLRAEAVDLSLASPFSGEQTSISFDYNTFAGAVRLMSYTPSTAALLPLLLHEAGNNNNWQPLAAQAQMTLLSLADSISEGMHNAIVCTEDVPFYDIDAAQLKNLAATYLGDLQVITLEAICDSWPGGLIDDDFHDALDSDIPVMLLSGTADPITPPHNGAEAGAQLANSLHVVVEGHGHGAVSRLCVPRLIADFVDAASFSELDTSCVEKPVSAPFFTSFAGPEP